MSSDAGDTFFWMASSNVIVTGFHQFFPYRFFNLLVPHFPQLASYKDSF